MRSTAARTSDREQGGRACKHLCGGVQQGSLLLIILHKSAVSAARERGRKKKMCCRIQKMCASDGSLALSLESGKKGLFKRASVLSGVRASGMVR